MHKIHFPLTSGAENDPEHLASEEITDVRNYLVEQRIKSSFLRQVIENLPVAVVVYDWINRRIMIVNAKFLATTQLSDIHEDFDPLTLIADGETRRTVHMIISKGFSSTLELRLNLPSQTILALTAINHIVVADVQAVTFCLLSTTAIQDRPGDARISSHDLLTLRELEITKLIAKGDTNDMIARRLGLKLGTVKNYTSDIYRKLDVNRRSTAIVRIKELELDL